MDFEKVICEIFDNQDDYQLRFVDKTTRIAALYNFYHYLNADISRLDEVMESIISTTKNESFVIKSILKSVSADDTIDFNIVLLEKDFNSLSIEKLSQKIKDISKEVGEIVYHDVNNVDYITLQKYDDLQIKLNEHTSFVIRVVCDFELQIERKIKIQQVVSELQVSNHNVTFEIIFGDDLEEEVADIENPKEYVPSGSIELINNSICSFGDEESFIALVSAKSLKQLFLQYSTRGLFASNLRFYITSKKIDSKIINTIQNEPQNFCYFNNGIIITCDNYELVDRRVVLSNFSIVNGGQTTNLIGRTSFENDFGVVCKIIKNKYENKNERVAFLSNVAEASNMQKPINAKDLIANKIEQRLFKIQFSEAGMFLKIKRGEKIDKTNYPEPYMNASNDELAQLLYSIVYQAPGAAKNSKSGLLNNDKIYNLIFKSQYDSNFFKSIQILKIAYSDWQKKIKKTETHSSMLYGLSRHANFYTFAIIGFIMKFMINNEFKIQLLKMKSGEVSNKNPLLKSILKVNDIGSVSLIKPTMFERITKTCFFDFFDLIFEKILMPAYIRFKKAFPNYAYGQFCKSDFYYYDYVVLNIKSFLNTNVFSKEISGYFKEYFNIEASADIKPSEEPDNYGSDSLENELKIYRNKVVDESGKTIKLYEVLKNIQIALIVKYFPQDSETLSNKCYLSDDQIMIYGKDIIEIVSKYIRKDDFE